MEQFMFLSILIVCSCGINSLSLSGPRVHVVTPAPRPQIDEGRSAPFYYHNWMRRMDPPSNDTSKTATTTENSKTPDLIFAEFEGGNQMKSIRKLLDKEKVETKTTTTSTSSRPIYVPDDGMKYVNLPPTPFKKQEEITPEPDRTDYFALYNNLYNDDQGPVYLPATTTTIRTTTTPTTTATSAPSVEDIWHIIDNQKFDQYSGKWEEETIADENVKDSTSEQFQDTITESKDTIDDNFALPGFSPNSGNGAENESRAIRTEPSIRFPYVNLKPFQMKTQMKPIMNAISSNKKGNNMFTSLDNFYDIKKPVRGEVQDVSVTIRQPIDRYNPAQPYLPQPTYGTKSKPSSTPVKTVASLVPPPPSPPRVTDGNFPAPTSYESFPPYPPSGPPGNSPVSVPAPKPSVMFQPPVPSDSSPDTDDSDSDGPPTMDLGYKYKPPSPPVFVPTLPPLSKPSGGYSYNKPPMTFDSSPDISMNDKPDFQGYHYSKPESSPANDHSHADEDHSDNDNPLDNYGPGSHFYNSDYPELIFDKPPHGMKDQSDMKDMGMVPPPPPPPMDSSDMKPDMDHGPPDTGFPHDFPGDLKFHHDFDDHDYHHHHHHHPTTTTEMPRVNRYSYYYLGKKLYYLPLYFSVYFIVYVGALIIKAVLRHKIVYPNSWRPNDTTATFFSKRSIDSFALSNEKIHDITGKVTNAIALAGEKYFNQKKRK